MTTFTATSGTLTEVGPQLDAEISLWGSAEEAIIKAGGTPPDAVAITALVDTGASGTSIEPWVVKKLGLTPVGTMPVTTPNSPKPVDCPLYAIRIFFPALKLTWEKVVVAASLEGQKIEGLIGRDFLQHCVMVYIGPSGTWSLSF